MRSLSLFVLLLLAIAAILLAPSAVRFDQSIGVVPPSVRLAGNTYEDASLAEVTGALTSTLSSLPPSIMPDSASSCARKR